MPETKSLTLSGVAETLLIPLYIRAMESQRSDVLVKDERAEAVVVHIGCGLDTRFERVDNGQVEWYDLDLPDAIELRRKLVGGEGMRHHFLACSVLDSAWMEVVSVHHQSPFLFLAEGVLMYFDVAQVKSLVLKLRDCFPGAELVFDAFSPFMRWGHNVRVTRTRVGAYLHWGLKHAQDLEQWGIGAGGTGGASSAGSIRLLDEHYPFQYPEPRMRRALQMRLFPFLAKAVGVFHYQL